MPSPAMVDRTLFALVEELKPLCNAGALPLLNPDIIREDFLPVQLHRHVCSLRSSLERFSALDRRLTQGQLLLAADRPLPIVCRNFFLSESMRR